MNAATIFKVIIVDDCVAFGQSLQFLLSHMPQYEVLAILSDGKDVIEYPHLAQADLIIMDMSMPIINGVDAGKQINYILPDIKLVAVTQNNDMVCLRELVEAGFRGYVLKHSIVEDLANVLNAVLKNELAFPKELVLRNIL
ncbi:response regulator transcription factor [Carboxylicivirga sediminis]|uniref:Response regulator transcription factor n=2 Tax=Carboxylicivirga sediminis TaxID=2006564 RepID=A0A941IYJ3_9BACT|nr:response regulator transcription factor [Carboxylicivirga sediminis]MBR8537946.1 response regulator transcription factor [Carboxylicivirga sediminis]